MGLEQSVGTICRGHLAFLLASSFFLLVANSCVSVQEEIVHKNCLVKMTEYPDSSFIGDLKCLQYHDGRLFFLDINRRSVLVVDNDFSSFQSVSMGGRGPGELLDPYSFTVSGDSIFVMDFGSNAMKTFVEGFFIGETSFPFMIRDQRFVKSEDVFYFPYRDPNASVISTTFDGPHTVILESEWYSNASKTVTMNSCNVLSYNDYLVIVPEALPWVKIVDKEGRVIKAIDLDQSATYRNNLSSAKRADGNNNSFYTLNSDACVVGDNLLLLVPTYEGQYKCNRILTLNLDSGRMARETIVLNGVAYSCICSDGTKIVAFNNSENQIEVYEL